MERLGGQGSQYLFSMLLASRRINYFFKRLPSFIFKQVFKHYIAYHEGWGNYKNYKQNKKVISLAKKVEKQSNIYKKQLSNCKSFLNRNKYIIF